MPVSGDDLYRSVTSASDKEALDQVNLFKAYVKKDFVDLSECDRYFQALLVALDSSINSALIDASFSVMAHLIRRVSIQDPLSSVLQHQAALVLPQLIHKLGDPKNSIRSTAKRALEAYWLSLPKEVESAILDRGLSLKNLLVVLESVLWLRHIVTEISQLFKLDPFLPLLVTNLRNEEEVQLAVKHLFSDYYSMKHNYIHKHVLLRELVDERIPQRVCDGILQSISNGNQSNNTNSSNSNTNSNDNSERVVTKKSEPIKPNQDHSSLSHSNSPVTSVANKNPRNLVPSSLRDQTRKRPTIPEASSAQDNASVIADVDILETPAELMHIISKLQKFPFDASLEAINLDNIAASFHALLEPFAGKETEFNWAQRERNIITLRKIIRGNANKNPEILVHHLKEFAEPISKAILSLRTTLSTNGCQLIKECAMILKSHADVLIDSLSPTLFKLCLATKTILSNNANTVFVAFFLNCSYMNKWLQKVQTALSEKNHQPRAHCCSWLEILITRFHQNPNYLSHHGTLTGPEVSSNIISKLLSDPNPTVRQGAKDLYWSFWSKFPTIAEHMLGKLDTNVVKALERARPKTLNFSSSPITQKLNQQPKRPSMRESIIARNKEIREKERLSRPSLRNVLGPNTSTSTSSSTSTSQVTSSTPFSLNRLSGGPRRNFTETTSSISSKPIGGHKPESRVVSGPSSQMKADRDSTQNKSFDKQTDPIVQFLSSHKQDLNVEGINLLKYAIMADEDLLADIPGLLKNISIVHPQVLRSLLFSTNDLTRKVYKFFDLRDFIRTYFILKEVHETDSNNLGTEDKSLEDPVGLLLSIIPPNDYYSSIATLLTQTTKISSILNNSDLVMQIIKYKSTIFANSIFFLQNSLDKVPITNQNFEQICECLFEIVQVLRGLPNYDNLISLLQKLNEINPEVFNIQLDRCSQGLKDEVRTQTNSGSISMSSSPTATMASHEKTYTSYDLTKVFPSNATTLSPLKGSPDFTMLVPVFNAKDEILFSTKSPKIDTEPQYDMVVEDNIDDVEMVPASAPTQENIFIDQNLNEKEVGGRRSELFAQFQSEKPTDLVKDFAQVQITAPDAIQSFVEKLDPINKFSSKKKPIQIYQDEALKGSPQKARNYDYEEMNWFNYLVTKARNKSHHQNNVEITDKLNVDEDHYEISNMEKFTKNCRNIGSGNAELEDFVGILELLQDSRFIIQTNETSLNFLLESLWAFFESYSNEDILIQGLVIIKQMLVCRMFIDSAKLWELILKLVGQSHLQLKKNETQISEINLALCEIFDEMILVTLSTEDAFEYMFETLTGGNLNPLQIVFVFECINKVLSFGTMDLYLTEGHITQIDKYISNYLNDDDVLVRRNVIQIYGRLLKKSHSLDMEQSKGDNSANTMIEILQKLPIPQKKLIEYYSEQ